MKKSILFYLLLINILCFSKVSYSQTTISGIINHYSAVDSIYPSGDTLLVQDASNFNGGDTIMVYQMKGAVVYKDTSNNENDFGKVFNNQINSAGKYEIVIVEKVKINEVILRNELINPYNVDHIVQIIRVPAYNNVVVEDEVTCMPWDGTKGGVIALMVNDTVFFNGNINTTGLGFNGGAIVSGNGDCANTDSLLFRSIYFDDTFTGAGEKGEGIGMSIDTMSRGYGYWTNGGGGGNGRFAGGGGGGNAGFGGRGSGEDTVSCSSTPDYIGEIINAGTDTAEWKGLGGRGGQPLYNFNPVSNYINDSTIHMGGGGGSGTEAVGFEGVNGGNGGGIVILIAKYIKTTFDGDTIYAKGETPADSKSSGGGAGAGGSIVFDVDYVEGNLNLNASGGKGGNVENGFVAGPGGGGGGGSVLLGGTLKPGVSISFSAGSGGEVKIDQTFYSAFNGETGAGLINIKVPLNGFLFNSITAKQNVCNGESILISGSQPRGGYDGVPFLYQWQQSINGTAWSDISGANDKDYQTPPLTDTIYYKRIVTNAHIEDQGIILKINVQGKIVGNAITGDDLVICVGNEADTVTGTRIFVGGDNLNYNYIWQYSLDENNDWINIDNHEDTICWPGIVQDTTSIRRVVVSGACYDTTYLSPDIIGLPQIANNSISEDQLICFKERPDMLIGTAPENGLGPGSYNYLWQESSNAIDWIDISGATGINYQPDPLTDTTYFRRLVFSDDCLDESNSVMIAVIPDISNNILENEMPMYTCYNTAPYELVGSEPNGGAGVGTYNYQWQDSIIGGSWQDIAEASTGKNYSPPALTDTTFFRRAVQSSVCRDTSNAGKVKILDLPIGSIETISDTICSGDDVILNFDINNIGAFPLKLYYNNGVDNIELNIENPGVNQFTVNPITLETDSTYLYTIYEIVDDSGCVAVSKLGTTTIEVYGNPLAVVEYDVDSSCLHEYIFNATKTFNESDAFWTQIEPSVGTTTFTDINNPKDTVSVDVSGTYTYQWKETNWNCVDSIQVEITYYLPVQNVYGGEDTILNFVDEYILTGTYTDPDDGSGIVIPVEKWDISSFVSINDISTLDRTINIYNLPEYFGEKITCIWRVNKGVCEEVSDTVTLTIQDVFAPAKYGFSPNGDTQHDFLKFEGIEFAESIEFVVYNRWGVEVFSTNDKGVFEIGWDGKNNNGTDLPDDTYFYILKYTNKSNKEQEPKKGFIVIKRN